MVHGQELYGVGLQETVACMDQGRRCCEKLNILKMFSRKANYRFYQHPMHVMLCLGRPSFRKTQSNLDFSKQWGGGGSWGRPNPNFLHGYTKSRFLGEGGVKDCTILTSRFIFVCINGQLRAIRGS